MTNTLTLTQMKMRNLIFNTKFYMLSAIFFVLGAFGGGNAFAVSVDRKAPTVGKDGKIDFGGPANLSPESGVSNGLTKIAFWVSAATAVITLLVVLWGIWYGANAAKEISENNQAGYKRAKNIAVAVIIFGLIVGTIAVAIAYGAATGTGFFEGSQGAVSP